MKTGRGHLYCTCGRAPETSLFIYGTVGNGPFGILIQELRT